MLHPSRSQHILTHPAAHSQELNSPQAEGKQAGGQKAGSQCTPAGRQQTQMGTGASADKQAAQTTPDDC